MVLSAEVLRSIASRVDQCTRVSCCLSSRRARSALVHPGAWVHVCVYKLEERALEFVQAMASRHVVIDVPGVVGAGPLEGFLAGLPVSLQKLELRVGDLSLARTHSIMSCICDITGLQQLVIECVIVRRPTCLAFPKDARVRDLRSIRIVELSEERNLEVYFDDVRLPSLRDVFLEVRTSDVLTNVKLYPTLSSVCYFASQETFEDARMECVRLDGLTVNVLSASAMGYLLCAAARASRVGALTLMCYSDVRIDAHLPTQSLYVHTMPKVSTVEFLFPVVRSLDHLSVHPYAIGARGSWTVRFSRTGSWHNFRSWLSRTRLHIGFEGSVVVDPA